MPRISSEKTRQVILVKDPVFDDTQVPERLALFDEEHQMISISLVSKGAWSTTAGYAENDLVTFEGSTYRAKVAKDPNLTGNDPPNVDADTWELLASKGAPGIEGINWRDNWEALNTYSPRDAVFHAGSSWRALKEIGANGAPPDTPQGVIPGSGPYAGLPSALWDISSNNRVGSISAGDQLVGNYRVDIVRVPIATPGNLFLVIDYFTIDGYLEAFNPDGTTAGASDDFGNYHTSAVNRTVVPGMYYFVFRSRSPGLVPNYTASITLSGGATFGTDTDPWKKISQKGDTGPIGPGGPPGPIANWRGLFDPTSAYERGDTVYWNGESWWAVDDMVAGAAPEPGVVVAWVHVGDGPAANTQHVYAVHFDEIIEGPLPNATSGQAVGSSGADVNWFKVQAEPGTTLSLTLTDAACTIWSAAGSSTAFLPSNSPTDRSITMPAEGVVYLEVGKSPAIVTTVPWKILVEGTPFGPPLPTWAKVVQKGADGAPGATGDGGPEGPQGPPGPAGLGEGGVGVPVGGVLGQLLRKISAVDYEMEWADPAETGSKLVQVLMHEKFDALNPLWTPNQGSIVTGLEIFNGTLRQTAADNKDHDFSREDISVIDAVHVLKTIPATFHCVAVYLKFIDDMHWVSIQSLDQANNVQLLYRNGGSVVTLASFAHHNELQPFWLVGRMVGDAIQAELHIVDPRYGGNPFSSAAVNLRTNSVPAATALGADIAGSPGCRVTSYNSAFVVGATRVDDWVVMERESNSYAFVGGGGLVMP